MDDESTSPVAVSGEPNSLTGEWARVRAFVARPRLPDPVEPRPSHPVAALLRVFLLDLALMATLAIIAAIVIASGIELPESSLANLAVTPGLIAAILIVAPVGEEIAFRGWLSGRKRDVLACVVFLGGMGATAWLGASDMTGAAIWSIAALTFTLGLTVILFWTARHRPAMRWFSGLFPLLYWLSTLAFACVHLFNFEEGALFVLLPLVLPQFVLGALLGYMRVTYGLGTSIVLHALHNGTAMALVALATVTAS